MDLRLGGGGEIDTNIVLIDGLPSNGSTLKIPREQLSMSLIDHRIDGQGEAQLTRVDGGKLPRIRLVAAFEDALLRRRDEPEPSIGDVRMDANLLVGNLNDAAGSAELGLRIHSARVHDMATYNAYLPPGLPLRIRSGQASLVSNLQLSPQSAGGELELVTDDITLELESAVVAGDVRIALLIRDGSSTDLRFDVTGSSIQLDDFKVHGTATDSQDASWYARLQLDDTKVRWHKPMHIDTKAQIVIKDTAPFLALMDNLSDTPAWIDDMLSMDGLAGHIRLSLDGERAVLEDAMVTGPEIGLHAKGRAVGDTREALLLRWHNLLGTLRLVDDDKPFSIIRPIARFDAYRPRETALASTGPLPVTAVTSPTQPSSADHAHREPASRRAKATKIPREGPAESDPFLDHSLRERRHTAADRDHHMPRQTVDRPPLIDPPWRSLTVAPSGAAPALDKRLEAKCTHIPYPDAYCYANSFSAASSSCCRSRPWPAPMASPCSRAICTGSTASAPNSGQLTRCIFTDLKRNPRLAYKMFRFKRPVAATSRSSTNVQDRDHRACFAAEASETVKTTSIGWAETRSTTRTKRKLLNTKPIVLVAINHHRRIGVAGTLAPGRASR